MRILVDEHDFSWSDAWRITNATLSYTNHTLLPEALESWPVSLLNRLLPRHMQIIYLINKLHLDDAVAKGLADPDMLASISLIQEGDDKRVRMGHLAFVGSHKINGVSALHTDLMGQTVFRDLDRATPGRIVNMTNGISFRRWLFEANPDLTTLLTGTLGERVLDDPNELTALERFADDASFVQHYAAIKRGNKEALARRIHELTGVTVDPSAMFDVQIKRIHEYKRQLLNILETIALYLAIRLEPDRDWTPRVKIFAGKAAASYERAKLIIKLANDVAQVINADPKVGDRLKVVFLPNYNVSLAQDIIPAADLSEQISTAGMEASGTGNMKLALNGALTIGTLDGANIEIRDRVGAENIFIFGLTADEVEQRRQARFTGPRRGEPVAAPGGGHSCIRSGAFSPDDADRFATIVDALLDYDHFMVAADFDAYWTAQRAVDALYGQAGLVASRHPQHGAHGLVFVGPRGPRIRRKGLGRGHRSAGLAGTLRRIHASAVHRPDLYRRDVPCRSHAAGRREVRRLGIRRLVRRQCGDGGVLLRQARHQARPDRDHGRRLARQHVPRHGGEIRHPICTAARSRNRRCPSSCRRTASAPSCAAATIIT